MNTDRPLISVVLPTYNSGRFLAAALDSALAQTYPNIEVIVINDGSTDDTVEVLARYPGRVRSFTQTNQGVSCARNRGVEKSRGEYIAFLDADDLWDPEKLTKQLPLFRTPDTGMVYCGLDYIDEHGLSLGQSTLGAEGWVLKEIALLTSPGVPTSGSTPLLRRNCLDSVGGFDENLSTSADWDLVRRIACRFRVAMVREPLVKYRQHPSAMHRNIPIFEADMRYAMGKMFVDDAAASVHALKRRCYANLHLTLAGSYLHAGAKGECAKHALRAMMSSPAALAYILAFPLRRERIRLSKVEQ
jgi:glycosyltransferase involved in cell wall biosynthesis